MARTRTPNPSANQRDIPPAYPSWVKRQTKRQCNRLRWSIRAIVGHKVTVPTDPHELLAFARQTLRAMAEDTDTEPRIRAQCATALAQSAQLEIRLRPRGEGAADEEAEELEQQLQAPGLRRVK